MPSIKTLLCLSALMIMLGCSPKQAEPAPSKPAGLLTDAQKKTLEKAKQVDDMLQEANEKRLKQIDEMK